MIKKCLIHKTKLMNQNDLLVCYNCVNNGFSQTLICHETLFYIACEINNKIYCFYCFDSAKRLEIIFINQNEINIFWSDRFDWNLNSLKENPEQYLKSIFDKIQIIKVFS